MLDGDPAFPPLKGHSPQFLSNVRCGQMAGWMKTPLSTDVDLGPGHIVLDGSQLCAKGAQQPPHLFGPCLLWPRSPISATAELLYYIMRHRGIDVMACCRPIFIGRPFVKGLALCYRTVVLSVVSVCHVADMGGAIKK